MPNFKKGHDDYRKLCCFFCLRKAQSKSDRTLSAGEINLIKANFFHDFDNFKDFLPLGCCSRCRSNLSYRFGKNPSSEKYKPFPCESDSQYYQNVIDTLRKLPRGSSQNKECTCFICEPAHTDFKSVKLQPGVPKPEFSNQVSRDNRTLDQSRLDEVTEKFENMTPKSKDAFVVLRIKEKQEQEQKSIEDPLSFRGAAGGAPIEVIAGAKAKKKLLYDNTTPVAKKVFENMAGVTDLSNRKAKLNAREFRKSEGKKSIEPGFAEDLSSKPKEILQKYFTTKYIELEVTKDEQIEMQTKKIVYCHDLPGYAKHIKEERGIKEDVDVQQKIGIDGGGGFFKVCLNIIKKDKADDVKSPPKKKPAYKDGGVKKLLIIGIVQEISETYYNAKTILKLLGIEKIDFVIATDYKLCNILLGLSPHGAKHRCPYCIATYTDFSNPRRQKCKLRTLGDIRHWHRKFKNHCEEKYPHDPSLGKKDVKHFYNCLEEPLFNLPDDTYIWDILPLFELHLRLGIINDLVRLLNDRWSKCTTDKDPFWKFCDENGIKKSTYRGNALEGPQTLILLEKLDLLAQKIPRRVKGSEFISALKSFRTLYFSCFQMSLHDNWQDHLRDFRLDIEKLKWTTGSTKLHIVLDHLTEFVLTKGPLGPFNEQASEAVHHDWKSTWDDYKKYPGDDNLLLAVARYNYRRT